MWNKYLYYLLNKMLHENVGGFNWLVTRETQIYPKMYPFKRDKRQEVSYIFKMKNIYTKIWAFKSMRERQRY